MNLDFLEFLNEDIESLDLSDNYIRNSAMLSRFKNLKALYLSNNQISTLKYINSPKIRYLYLSGNPILLAELEYIKELCYSGVLFELYIDRAVFKEYGDYFGLYPEYLQWIDYIYFVEKNGKVTKWHVITY